MVLPVAHVCASTWLRVFLKLSYYRCKWRPLPILVYELKLGKRKKAKWSILLDFGFILPFHWCLLWGKAADSEVQDLLWQQEWRGRVPSVVFALCKRPKGQRCDKQKLACLVCYLVLFGLFSSFSFNHLATGWLKWMYPQDVRPVAFVVSTHCTCCTNARRSFLLNGLILWSIGDFIGVIAKTKRRGEAAKRQSGAPWGGRCNLRGYADLLHVVSYGRPDAWQMGYWCLWTVFLLVRHSFSHAKAAKAFNGQVLKNA